MPRQHARTVRSLLVAALALLCTAPARAKASTPASAAGAAGEKELLAAFKDAFAASDPAARAAAVTTLGNASRNLPDKGAGKKVAQALAKGLEDDELEVCQATVFQFARLREVETVTGALEPFLRELREQLERKVESSDGLSRNFVERATVVFENAGYVLANYEDDRSAATLVPLLAGLDADTKKNDLGSRLIGALAAATLELGTEAAVETAVKLTKTFKLPAQAAGARKLHDALTEFATEKGMTPPDWGDFYTEQWHTWLEAHRNKLPKTLGKLAAPPTSDPSHPLSGLPGKSG